MNKVTMPEPEAFLYVNGEHRGVSLNFRDDMDLSEGTVRHALITTDQAEAYATARVRAAMSAAFEKAAQRSMRMPHYSDFERGYAEGRSHAAMEIREFIPKEPT